MPLVPPERTNLLKRVLGDDYFQIVIEHLSIEDNVKQGICTVAVRLSSGEGVAGTGVGLVDALFNGLLDHYAGEYQSLKTIELVSINLEADPRAKRNRSGMSAVVEVSLDVRNSRGTIFEFSHRSRSITTSSGHAVSSVAEYFVNSEKAYRALYRSLLDAKERNRVDLVERYTAELAEVVKSTSYTQVVERVRKEVDL